MDEHVFLAAQHSLLTPSASLARSGEPGAKRTRTPPPLACKVRFHISLSEQRKHPSSSSDGWLGALAADAVRIRLHSCGAVKATLDASIDAAAQRPVLTLSDGGASYAIAPRALFKVVCSPGVYAAACCAVESSSTLVCVAAAGSVQLQQQLAAFGAEFASIVMPHVCLDLLVPLGAQDAVEQLGGAVAAMHANAACNTAAGDLVPAAAQVQHAQQQQWLAAAASEVQLMQLLLQRNTPMAAAQERHLLDAVGHVHASLAPAATGV